MRLPLRLLPKPNGFGFQIKSEHCTGEQRDQRIGIHARPEPDGDDDQICYIPLALSDCAPSTQLQHTIEAITGSSKA